MRIAIVTGATGGLGKEFINNLLLENLDEIWATGRNESKLQGISQTSNRIRTIAIYPM
ncbi:MAG: polysaccharide biosynthesis protein [Anaeroplasmataceae bacterium]|nr:polysaccharide biosynthesis protein [Anaeroplasmataceae bacterium]